MDRMLRQIVTIIVNFNTSGVLRSCIDSLLDGAAGHRYMHHIVIWENGDERSLWGYEIGAKWWEKGATLFYQGAQGNLGYARAVNRAYEWWRSDVGSAIPLAIHCANPDTVSEPGALDELVLALERYGWGAAAPIASFQNGRRRRNFYPLLTPPQVVAHFLRLRVLSRIGARRHISHPQEVRTVDGSYVVFSQEAWAMVGGLDSHYGIATDDHDMCARLRRAGWSIGVTPTSRVVHVGASARTSRPLLCSLDEIHASLRYVGKFYGKSVPLVRLGIAALVRGARGSLGPALAWWAMNAPMELEAAPNLEEMYMRTLASFGDHHARNLRLALEAECRGAFVGTGPSP